MHISKNWSISYDFLLQCTSLQVTVLLFDLQVNSTQSFLVFNGKCWFSISSLGVWPLFLLSLLWVSWYRFQVSKWTSLLSSISQQVSSLMTMWQTHPFFSSVVVVSGGMSCLLGLTVSTTSVFLFITRSHTSGEVYQLSRYRVQPLSKRGSYTYPSPHLWP